MLSNLDIIAFISSFSFWFFKRFIASSKLKTLKLSLLSKLMGKKVTLWGHLEFNLALNSLFS